jgi:hypothetical protein
MVPHRHGEQGQRLDCPTVMAAAGPPSARLAVLHHAEGVDGRHALHRR